MSETGDFQRLADECLTRADDPNISPQKRKALIEAAMAWRQLAQETGTALGEGKSRTRPRL